MSQIPTRMLKQHAIPNSSLENLKKFIHQKGAENLAKDEFCM